MFKKLRCSRWFLLFFFAVIYSFLFNVSTSASDGVNLLVNPGFGDENGECYSPTTTTAVVPGWSYQYFGFGEMNQGDGFPQNQPFKVCAVRTKGEAYGTGDGGKIPIGETGWLSQIVAVPGYTEVVFKDARMEHESGEVLHRLSGCTDESGADCTIMGETIATIPQVKDKSICDFYVQTMTFTQTGGISSVTYGDPTTCDLSKLPEPVNFDVVNFDQYPYLKVEVRVTPLSEKIGQSGYKAGWWSLEVSPISPTATPTETPTPTPEPSPTDTPTPTLEPTLTQTPTPTPIVCSCSAIISPLSASIVVGDAQSYEALVAVENCSVSQVDFVASDETVASVLETTDTDLPYTTSVFGGGAGVSDVSALVTTDDGQVTCSDTGTLQVFAEATPTPTETPTPTPTFTPTPTLTPTPTPTLALSLNVMDLEGVWYRVSGVNTWFADVLIVVEDQNDQPVENVYVSGSWNAGVPTSSECLTNSFGQCVVTDTGLTKSETSVSYTVESLSLEGYEYHSEENRDIDGDSDGTTFTVIRQ